MQMFSSEIVSHYGITALPGGEEEEYLEEVDLQNGLLVDLKRLDLLLCILEQTNNTNSLPARMIGDRS